MLNLIEEELYCPYSHFRLEISFAVAHRDICLDDTKNINKPIKKKIPCIAIRDWLT